MKIEEVMQKSCLKLDNYFIQNGRKHKYSQSQLGDFSSSNYYFLNPTETVIDAKSPKFQIQFEVDTIPTNSTFQVQSL